MALRLFFGLPVAGAAADALQTVCQRLADLPAWRQTPRLNWHLTLVFLGAIDEVLLPELVALGERACAAHAPFSGRLDRLGWLPGRRRPRLLAALAADAAPFQPLHTTLKDGAEALGFAIETRPLLPHVTLLRRRKSIAVDADEPALDTVAAHPPSATGDILLPVAELVLYQSVPGAAGPRYLPLWQAPLTGVS